MKAFNAILEKAAFMPEDKSQARILRDIFCKEFHDHFLASGFSQYPAGSLIPETDTSVLFTGSTISTLKPVFMEERIPEQGVFMIQQCLRTQNAMQIQESSFVPKWSSAFLSTRTLSRYEDLDKVSDLFWTFLTQRLGLDQTKIRVHIASSDADILGYWKGSGLEHQLLFDTKEPVYYTHKYGIDGVRGRNCNIAIKGHGSDEFRDIGNIIIIETDDKKLAVEMAYGVETAISRMLGVPTPIHAAPMAEFLPVGTTDELKIVDALAASTLILSADIKPLATNRGRVLRRYLQGISELQPNTSLTYADLQEASEKFEQSCIGTQSDAGAFIAKYVADYQALKATSVPDRGKLNKKLTQITPKL